jgi:hypothetical protein
MGFSSFLEDRDVWLRSTINPGGAQYYKYILVYVDDIMAISIDPQSIMDTLSEHYTLKAGKVRAPKLDPQKHNGHTFGTLYSESRKGQSS